MRKRTVFLTFLYKAEHSVAFNKYSIFAELNYAFIAGIVIYDLNSIFNQATHYVLQNCWIYNEILNCCPQAVNSLILAIQGIKSRKIMNNKPFA